MALRSFKEWKQLNEAKGMHNNQPPRENDVQKMRRTGKLGVQVKQANRRVSPGKTASACTMGKKGYDRTKFKRGECDQG
jgi:hypothetical protein